MGDLPILPVDDPCGGCGACCHFPTLPPFGGWYDASYVRLEAERPDLLAAIHEERTRLRAAGLPLIGTTCHWFDTDSRRCRHYDYRPDLCREFAAGGDDCRGVRARAGMDRDPPGA